MAHYMPWMAQCSDWMYFLNHPNSERLALLCHFALVKAVFPWGFISCCISHFLWYIFHILFAVTSFTSLGSLENLYQQNVPDAPGKKSLQKYVHVHYWEQTKFHSYLWLMKPTTFTRQHVPSLSCSGKTPVLRCQMEQACPASGS